MCLSVFVVLCLYYNLYNLIYSDCDSDMRIIDPRIDFVVLSILCSFSVAEDLLAQVKCESHPVGYIVPDPTYCDRYLLCRPGGERETRVCEQGQKFDFNTAGCALDSVVICGDRTKTWRDKRQEAPRASRP